MPFELFVALRYLRDGRLQTILILTGIGVGVGVIIFLSALIGGLQRSLIDRTLGSQALIVVRPPDEMPRVLGEPDGSMRVVETERPPQRVRSIVGWKEVVSLLVATPGVEAVAPTVTGPAIAIRGLGSISVSVRGVDVEDYGAIVDVRERLIAGAFDLEGAQVVVGQELAQKLGVTVGGRIRIQTAGSNSRLYTISGLFDFQSQDLNERLVFVSLRGAQTLFGLEGGVSTLEVRNRQVFEADALADQIEDRTGLVADSWIEQNQNLLVGLRSQSTSSIMIQVFVILAVALGIASVLAVSVVQRSREIGILRATGTRAGTITRIFLWQGGLLGIVGSLVGIGLGIALGVFFDSVARNPDGSASFPIDLTLALYLRSGAIALGVGLAAALIPARNAARMDPATVIRDG